ncbi:MAG: hypothetical protein JWR21_3907 [Herminiimonas sp.]|nr:hypothetical protein [Herminiimonas sp.]MDB5852762.1 hypothetical protein [Herminiimonas sp.]
MESTSTGARIADEGIFFTIAAGFADRECVVLQGALATLAEDDAPDYMQIYQQHEYDIHLAARRLFLAGETSTPLVVDAIAVVHPEGH